MLHYASIEQKHNSSINSSKSGIDVLHPTRLLQLLFFFIYVISYTSLKTKQPFLLSILKSSIWWHRLLIRTIWKKFWFVQTQARTTISTQHKHHTNQPRDKCELNDESFSSYPSNSKELQSFWNT